jgi:ADP-ribosylglycohydrolase
MLEKQPWINYPGELLIEWIQAKDEGKLVDHLKAICTEVSKFTNQADFSKIADEIRQMIERAHIDENYPYIEPSDLDGIKQALPQRRHIFINSLSNFELLDKITGAWIGRISGCLIGKPVEGFKKERLHKFLLATNNYPMSRYITTKQFTEELIKELDLDLNACWADIINGIAPIDDDTNYTVLALKLIENYGLDFKSNDVLEAWLTYIPMFQTCTAERVAYRNATMGMLAPDTATFQNPYREWIGAQIRGDFFGYINIANPHKAAEFAFRDACISHVKNGIYGEMFISAMISAAAVCSDIITVIEAGLDEIPHKSRLRKDIGLVLSWFNEGISAEQAIENIHQSYNEASSHDWCHTNSNAMIVATALIFGQNDFGKSICLAVQAAFDTDCNGATVGSILGIMLGAKSIPEYWSAAFNNKLSTSIIGYTEMTVCELAKKTIQIIKANN